MPDSDFLRSVPDDQQAAKYTHRENATLSDSIKQGKGEWMA
jgi:hypothetical protein